MQVRILPLLFVVVFSFLRAQENGGGKIVGLVLEQASGRPLTFVNVALQREGDSTIVTGTVTDRNGRFEVTRIPPGSYIVRFSLIGYKEKNSAVFAIAPQHDKLNLGTIRLVETTVDLDEVLVTGKQQLFNNRIDRKVYNVEQDIATTSGSAADLLQNIPSIEVDLDGNVALRGSDNVLILINGKNSPLMGRSRSTVLQQMPANTIDKIEVITNPSAKYNPEGTSGIINIILKKETEAGINGSASANAGNNSRYNANVQLNYRPGSYNLFGSYGIRADNRDRYRTDSRDLFDPTSPSRYYREDLSSYASPLTHSIGLGIEGEIDEANSIGLSGNMFLNGFTRNDTSRRMYQDVNKNTVSRFDRVRHDPEFENEYGFALTYEHKFNTDDHKLQFEFTGSNQPEEEDNRYTNFSWVPPAPVQYDNALIKQAESQYQITLDYTTPLSPDSRLEAGYNGEINGQDMDYRISDYDPVRQMFVTNVAQTNRFLFDESIHALYATFNHSFGNFGFLAGGRVEGAFRKFNLVTLDSVVTDRYFSFYPTLHLSYRFSDRAELQLNYSRRTRRPDGDDLNPFPEYLDPRNISAGNPKLLPEYIHSLELGMKIESERFSVLPSVYYRSTYNRFTSVTQALNDTTLLTTEANLSTDQAGGVELIVTANFGELVTSHANVNGFYSRIDASNLGFGTNKSTIAWSGAITVDVNATPSTIIQMNSNFRAARLTPQGENKPSYIVNFGIRHVLIEQSLFLVFTVSDLFKTLRSQTTLTDASLSQTVINSRDSRIFYFGLTYNFGAPPKKTTEEMIRYDESL